jgi:hypothetical protein
MAETWTVSVGGRSYGPYTATQMHAFATEGRLAPHSLVCLTGETVSRPASEFRQLAALFRTERSAPNSQTVHQPAFGRNDRHEGAPSERSQFIIMADLKSGSLDTLEAEISNLGPSYAVLPQAWIVSSEQSVNAIRNALVQKLGKRDVLFIVDATHNKAAWFNFGPEIDARIRRIWNRTPEITGTRGSTDPLGSTLVIASR